MIHILGIFYFVKNKRIFFCTVLKFWGPSPPPPGYEPRRKKYKARPFGVDLCGLDVSLGIWGLLQVQGVMCMATMANAHHHTYNTVPCACACQKVEFPPPFFFGFIHSYFCLFKFVAVGI